MGQNLGRSIGALFAGFVAVVALSIGTDSIMRALGVFPPWNTRMSDSLFVLAFAYRSIYGIAGSYLVAALAPDRPMGHALVSGAVGVVMSGIGLIIAWNAGPELGPSWYPLALFVTALPYAWLGGKLYVMKN